jgi:beta-lactamase class A
MIVAGLTAALSPAAELFGEQRQALAASINAIEQKSGGRIGWALLDTGSGRRFGNRDVDRFPMCSTFKLLAVSLVLHRVDEGQEQLERRIAFSRQDLVTYSPATEAYAGGSGMTIKELCAAAITLSDNTAANLLLASFGGPPALTRFARSMDDPTTRLDRIEPSLNEATPGDPRDTTTPAQMLENMRRLLFGEVLKPASRAQLTDWLIQCKTGGERLRAGFPAGWKIGDKTGSGEHGTTNDIAVIWPPHRAPVLLAVYFTGSSLSGDERSTVLAQVGKAAREQMEQV